MAKLYELDWGYKVRIKEGEHEGKEGIIVMGYRSGRVHVCFAAVPTIGSLHRSCATEDAINLELVLRQDPFHIGAQLEEHEETDDVFEGARRYRSLMRTIEGQD